jgi:hypothetical protein
MRTLTNGNDTNGTVDDGLVSGPSHFTKDKLSMLFGKNYNCIKRNTVFHFVRANMEYSSNIKQM